MPPDRYIMIETKAGASVNHDLFSVDEQSLFASCQVPHNGDRKRSKKRHKCIAQWSGKSFVKKRINVKFIAFRFHIY